MTRPVSRSTAAVIAVALALVAGFGDRGHAEDIQFRLPIACTLGGPARRTLFLLSSTDAYPKRLIGTRDSRLDTVTVAIPDDLETSSKRPSPRLRSS